MRNSNENTNHPRLMIVATLQLLFILGLGSTTRNAAAENVITCQPDQETSVEYGDIVNCSIEVVGDSNIFRSSGSIGETIRVQTARLSGGSACFQVFDPDGIGIFGNRCQPTDYQLEKSGPHTILVSELGDDGTVNYALTVERMSPPSPTARQTQYGTTLNDNIGPIGDIDPFFFLATIGDSVRVQTARLSGGSACFQVFDPDGIGIFGNRCQPTDYQLEKSGPYTILVSEFGDALTVQCTSGDCTVVPIPDVEGCIKLNGAPLTNRTVRLTQTGEPTDSTVTDSSGCYEFPEGSLVSGKKFNVRILGPVVP